MNVVVIHPRTLLQIAWVNSEAHQPFLDFKRLLVLNGVGDGDRRRVGSGYLSSADDDQMARLVMLVSTCNSRLDVEPVDLGELIIKHLMRGVLCTPNLVALALIPKPTLLGDLVGSVKRHKISSNLSGVLPDGD